MAEYVRSRYRAARFTATVAILGVLAGLGLGKAPGPEETLDFDDAAARGNVITIAGNSITSKHIKNGTLLTKDFKKGELSRDWTKVVLKFLDEHVSETEFASRFDHHWIKYQPTLMASIDQAFVGEGELEQKSADIFLKIDSSPRKVMDSTYVEESEFDSKIQKHSPDLLSRNFVHNDDDCDDGAPDAGESLAQFDLSSVGPDAQDGNAAPTTVCTIQGFISIAVSAPNGTTSWTTVITNLLPDSSLMLQYSPTGDAVDANAGGSVIVAKAGGSTRIAQTGAASMRTIQVAQGVGAGPVATITLSGLRTSPEAPVRVATQTLVARP
jgi:hypothetical protein